MDPKQKMIFGAIAGGCVVLIIAFAVLLVGQIGAMNEARDARDSAESELRGYYNETPYPSKINRDNREQDEGTYIAVCDAAKALLAKPLTYPEGESPSQFVTRVVNTIHDLDARKNATRVALVDSVAKNKASMTAEGPVMDYSFGRYVVQGELPKEADVPRLAKQFAVIEHVCDLLLDAGALDVTQVTREMFDAATEKPEEDTGKRTRRTRRNAKEEKKTATATGVVIPEELAQDGVTGEQFSVTFRANYAAVAKAMNALNTDDLFIVVTDLAFNNTLDLRNRVAEMVKRRQSARATAARRARNRKDDVVEAPATDEGLFANAAPAERLLTDPENALPLEVTLKFEVYSVPPAEEPETAEAEAAE
ncbi:MAG: Amuc_1100 family pilus-like protein [Kiritimatiellae bacterium]|nr:Amuc_1100 family pilus-like protein [Kiritimatiellia bacterium]